MKGIDSRRTAALPRRAFSTGALGTLGALVFGCESAASPGIERSAMASEHASETKVKPGRVPVGFVGHGAPTLALDASKGGDLARWGRGLRGVKGIVSISAHYTLSALAIGATARLPLIYDFSGFPKPLYEVRYPAPGAPDLAARVVALLGSAHPVLRQPERGHDHGTWVPLVHLFPKADVPVLSLSLPLHYSPQRLIDLGRRLSPLRDEGVFILGSGNITHNLRAMRPDGTAPESFATEFDDWCRQALDAWDVDALLAYRHTAPALSHNHPTEEHFLPLLVALGAAGPDKPRVSYPVQGFEYGNLSRRSVEFG